MGGQNCVKSKWPKDCFEYFLNFLNLLILKISGLDFCWKWRAILKGFDNIWTFLGGHLEEKREKTGSIFSQDRVHSWVLGCLVRMDTTINFCKFEKLGGLKRQICQNLRCDGPKTLYFLIFQRICENIQLHPSRGGVANVHENGAFWGGCWAGGLVFSFRTTSLGPEPSSFLLLFCVFIW